MASDVRSLTRPGPRSGTTAEAVLAALVARGVRRIHVNGGTDFAPLVEAHARAAETGLPVPEVVVCAHEHLAVGMAHGAYLATGEPQVVMLHTTVGTANAVCGVLNAVHARVPLLVIAGRTPLFEDTVPGGRTSVIHWPQEMFDQAGMLREAVKWDYELRAGSRVAAVLDRALDVAFTEPRGPVYLTLPREVLAAPAADVRPPPASVRPPAPAAPDPAAVAELADRLTCARFPVIVTPSSGADPSTVPLLDELCERFAVAVVEAWPRHVNVRADHPMHAGYDLAAVLADADVLCFLDADVPWVPAAGSPSPTAFVAHCGPDPHFGRQPIRTHRTDLSITASNRLLLEALLAALAERSAHGPVARRAVLAPMVRRLRPPPPAPGDGGRIDRIALNRALREVRPPGAVVFSEYWVRPDILASTIPGTYFAHPPAGGLGWGLPAAIGWQHARPADTVIAAVGDGAYLFANPAACHHVMAAHDLPVLTIVCANGKWGGVERSAWELHPGGHVATAGRTTPYAALGPLPAFEDYARASQGFGLRVTAPDELVPALRAALTVVRDEHRHALVNVECA